MNKQQIYSAIDARILELETLGFKCELTLVNTEYPEIETARVKVSHPNFDGYDEFWTAVGKEVKSVFSTPFLGPVSEIIQDIISDIRSEAVSSGQW